MHRETQLFGLNAAVVFRTISTAISVMVATRGAATEQTIKTRGIAAHVK